MKSPHNSSFNKVYRFLEGANLTNDDSGGTEGVSGTLISTTLLAGSGSSRGISPKRTYKTWFHADKHFTHPTRFFSKWQILTRLRTRFARGRFVFRFGLDLRHFLDGVRAVVELTMELARMKIQHELF